MKSPKIYKKLKNYTIVLVPEKNGKSKYFNISKKFLTYSFCSLLIIIVLLTSFFINYSNLKRKNLSYKTNNEQLSQLNLQKTAEIQSMKENMDKNNEELKNTEVQLKSKLRELDELEVQIKEKLNDKGIHIESSNTINFELSSADDIIKTADHEINSLMSLVNNADKKIYIQAHQPSILPYYGTITSYFGVRKSPTSRGKSSEYHSGIDIAGSYGADIRCAADGIVEFAGWNGAYGKLIIVNHGNGYQTLYGHNSKLLVKSGQSVSKGQVISKMGSTGRSTGCHVHFEIRLNGNKINPLKVIK